MSLISPARFIDLLSFPNTSTAGSRDGHLPACLCMSSVWTFWIIWVTLAKCWCLYCATGGTQNSVSVCFSAPPWRNTTVTQLLAGLGRNSPHSGGGPHVSVECGVTPWRPCVNSDGGHCCTVCVRYMKCGAEVILKYTHSCAMYIQLFQAWHTWDFANCDVMSGMFLVCRNEHVSNKYLTLIQQQQ